jgi:hypothetical protein
MAFSEFIVQTAQGTMNHDTSEYLAETVFDGYLLAMSLYHFLQFSLALL